ncbi:putative reverse transcriptase domain-containing protein [Tanacetum coccineum]
MWFRLQALVDRKKIIITEATVRRDLQLEDADGVDYLPNVTIFEQLTIMGAKTTAWNEFSSNMASAIICLATNQKFNFSKYIFESMVKNLDNAVKFLMYPRFVQVFLNNQLEGMATDNMIYIAPSHTKKIFANMRRQGKYFSGRVTPLFPTMVVQAQEEMGVGSAMPTDPHHTPIITQPSSSQPQRKQKSRSPKEKDTQAPQSIIPSDLINIADEAVNEEPKASLGDQEDASKKGREIHDMDADKDITLENVHDAKMFDVNDLDGDEVVVESEVTDKADEKRNIVEEAVDVTDAVTIPVSATTITNVELTVAQTLAELKSARPKTKGVVIQDPSESTPTISLQLPSQVKGQGSKDKDRLARKKAQQVEEANIAWDEIQAKIDADYQLVERLQAQEQQELTIEEKSTLFVQLLEKRKKHFAAKRAEEKRNRPSTRAQQRSAITELVEGTEMEESSKKAEVMEESSLKRAGDELEQENAKKQKMDDDQEEAKMKELIKIIPDEEEVAVDVIPLATKPLSIMLRSFYKEDLETLWKLVKAKHGYTRPDEGYERVLWGDLKIMFEHHIEDVVGINTILGVYTEMDEVTNLQCDYLEALEKCERLEKELLKSRTMSKSFKALQKHAINLELALQQCKEHIKNDKSFKENQSNVFLKEREQYFEIQDLKAQLQDKGIAISELKKLIEYMKGKSVENKFEKSSVIRQPNAFKSQNQSILGVIPTTSVSRPWLKSNQLEDRFMPNNSQWKKQEVEDHHRNIKFLNNKTSVTACNDSLNAKTSNWKPKSPIGNVNTNVSMPLENASRTANILEPITPRSGSMKSHYQKGFYVEGLNHNLFSVGQLCDADLEVAFRKSTCYIRDLKRNDLLTRSRGTDLYSIILQDTSTPNPICLMAKAISSQAWLWHRRLSHLNFDTINLLSKNDIVIDLPKLKFIKDHLCSSCELRKAKQMSFHTKTTPSSKRRLQLLHMDLYGPIRVESINGKNILVQRGLHVQVRTVRTDKDTKFLNKTLHAYFNRTLVEAARTMLSAAKVPLFFWAEAITTACFSQNRSLVIPQHEKTPYHIINGRKPSVKFFHIFGSLCYIVRDGENLDKIKEKGDACIFVGYFTQSRSYKVFNKRTRIIVKTIHVNFDELPQMASTHVSSDPIPQCPTTALEQDSLSPGPQNQENVPHAAETVTTSNELDFLFSLMFDELLNGTTQVLSKYSAITTTDAPNQRQQQHITPSTSTTVAADTPPLNIQTTPETTSQAPTQAPPVTATKNINQAETNKENAQVEKDEFINIFSTPV